MPWRARHAALRLHRPAIATAATVAGTLALGWGLPWPAAPGPAALAAWADFPGAVALAAITATGLIAHQVARASTPRRTDAFQAALPATLAAATMLPGMGLAALFPPLILVFFPPRATPANRVVAAMVHCGAGAAVAGDLVNQKCLIILG